MKQNIYDNEKFFKQYEAIRNREYNYNNLLEQPNFMQLMVDVGDKVVLDIGCGMGDFAAFCASHEAKHVIGTDISSNMIRAARKKHTHKNLTFQQIAFEDMDLTGDSIDIICSSLAFHYIADFNKLIKKISHALCEGGILLFSIEHPIVTANKGNEDWIIDEDGQILHYAFDNYQKEGYRSQNWLVNDVVTYHRTISTIINTLIENGIQIEKIVEPIPTEEAAQKFPTLKKQLRCPSFLIIRGKKHNIGK